MAKILVVDDQLGVRRLLFETFREDQHEVEMAANGEEAIRLLTIFKPDLILMDMKMPGMSGLETLAQIRSMNQQVDVIMMTAYGDAQNLEQAKDLGIRYYIGKPFDLFELRKRVKGVLTKTSKEGTGSFWENN